MNLSGLYSSLFVEIFTNFPKKIWCRGENRKEPPKHLGGDPGLHNIFTRLNYHRRNNLNLGSGCRGLVVGNPLTAAPGRFRSHGGSTRRRRSRGRSLFSHLCFSLQKTFFPETQSETLHNSAKYMYIKVLCFRNHPPGNVMLEFSQNWLKFLKNSKKRFI